MASPILIGRMRDDNRLVEHAVSLGQGLSSAMQWIVILVVAILPLVLTLDALRRLKRAPVAGSKDVLRKRAAYFAAGSNVLAYALPIVLLVHNVKVNAPWDWEPFQYALIALGLLSIALGVCAPRNVRPQLLIAALMPLLFWFLLPRGIL